MFGFKVAVTVLMLMLMALLFAATWRTEDYPKGKVLACIIFFVDAMSIIAIWG